jgi:hypothetical protein
MPSLVEQLTRPGKRDAVVRDSVQVLDQEVSDKSGLSGMAVKATFALVKGLAPDFMYQAVDGLLDDFVRQVEPFYLRWVADPARPTARAFFVANGSAVADSLLSITDGRASRSKHKHLVSAYQKLRPKGKEHVVAAMPRLGDLIERQSRELRGV